MLALLSLPNPLHPAVVHFPIVLVLLGSVVAVAAAFTRKWHLPVIAAALLVVGAIGAVTAVQTGRKEGELAGETPAIEFLLDRHEEWAERTQIAAIIVALLAVGAVVVTRWPVAMRVLGAAAAAGALVAIWCVIETGHYGGQLVYRHGTGVNIAPNGAGEATTGNTPAQHKARRAGDDD